MHKALLPIDSILPDVISALRSDGAVVLKAEPGAGKTTRVPPAILDGGLANLPDGAPGQIVVLQPRRIAARAAAARIADERDSQLGKEIGYQVRHEKMSSAQTRILVCTEGIFLRRLQEDPFLEGISAVVFDEFHERSIDSDLALALARQVRLEVRPDLRLIVMSATLDGAPVSAYLGGCKVLESPGRTYPVQVEYLQFEPTMSLPDLVADGVKKMMPRSDGHILAFLPGIGEIRQTQELLEAQFAQQSVLVSPLYGEMSLDEQQRTLRPSKERKIILATNVAETSVTIDGVTAVVDSGFARVNRFEPQLGLNRLQLARISRASAEQRAGRAGRTGPGSCLRLWTERQHFALAEFDLPEINLVDLSQSLLQILSWGESDIQKFPWFEAPPAQSIESAMQLLELLDATESGALTDLGKRMAQLPLQPRLARLIIEGLKLGCGSRAALCAALLSERDPIRRSDKPAQAQYHFDSDVVERIVALEEFAERGSVDSKLGMLMKGTARQILRASQQLEAMVNQQKGESSPVSAAAKNTDALVMQALVAAFPDRVCKRRQPNDRRALMVGGRGVRLSDESGVMDDGLFIAVEILDSKQRESLVKQASAVRREWLPARHLNTSIDAAYHAERKKVVAAKTTKYCDLVLEEHSAPLPADMDVAGALAEGIRTNLDLDSLVGDAARSYMVRIVCLRHWLPELDLPDFGASPWNELLEQWCQGCSAVDDLNEDVLIACIQARLNREQIMAVENEAPVRYLLPSGRTAKIEYEADKEPVLAVRIQELFGVSETPRIARGRVSVLLHLLAPNYRVQQITPDLASFWKNTYPDVKKDLKSRYPKQAWPDNPLTAQPPVSRATKK